MTVKRKGFFLLLTLLLVACGQEDEPKSTYRSYIDAVKLGDETTVLNSSHSSHAYSAPAANLNDQNLALHLTGDAFFEQSFIPAPAPDLEDFDGLGPAFNNTNCNACHQNDGRGSPPVANSKFVPLQANESLLVRISIQTPVQDQPGNDCEPTYQNDYCAPKPVPGFGRQLFHRGVFGLRPTAPFAGLADVYLRYEYSTFSYPDGKTVELRKPVIQIRHPYDAPMETALTPNPSSRLLQADVRTSVRIGPAVFGLGLLEAISEEDILSYADPQDTDNDGISGRPNYVFDAIKAKNHNPDPVSLGRFGWKANEPTVRQQALGALHGDIGITNELFPQESIAGTPLHDNYLMRYPADSGTDTNGTPEANPSFTDPLVFYVQSLHVPARRNVNEPAVRWGAVLFDQAGCDACHRPRYVTGQHPAGIAAMSGQEIFPFTDLLLHDMGPGLADHREDFQASGSEWRTAPLWGIGLARTVNPQAGFLHDGRARTIEEAILWHGGEAQQARNAFVNMTETERDALLAFLHSL